MTHGQCKAGIIMQVIALTLRVHEVGGDANMLRSYMSSCSSSTSCGAVYYAVQGGSNI